MFTYKKLVILMLLEFLLAFLGLLILVGVFLILGLVLQEIRLSLFLLLK